MSLWARDIFSLSLGVFSPDSRANIFIFSLNESFSGTGADSVFFCSCSARRRCLGSLKLNMKLAWKHNVDLFNSPIHLLSTDYTRGWLHLNTPVCVAVWSCRTLKHRSCFIDESLQKQTNENLRNEVAMRFVGILRLDLHESLTSLDRRQHLRCCSRGRGMTLACCRV